MRVTVYTECIYVLAEYLKYYAFKGIVIFFGKMWVALKRAGCCVVAFGGYINCAFVPQLFQQFINIICFVQLFSGNFDQIRKDNEMPPADLWRRAVRRGHGASLRPRLIAAERRRRRLQLLLLFNASVK